MSAWIVREWFSETERDSRGRPKRKRAKVETGRAAMRDTKPGDVFVVEWIDPRGKRCREKIAGTGRVAKRLADERCGQLAGQLQLGVYEDKRRETWADFREQYDAKILAGMEAGSRRVMKDAMAHFERLIKPCRMVAIDTETIDDFVARRRLERGRKKGSVVSKATVNKELRCLRATLRKAAKWGYLKTAPDFSFLKEDGKLPRYVTPEHFAAIYGAAHVATLPDAQGYAAGDWWRALFVVAYMTGWRRDEILTLLRSDVDLDAGEAMLRAINTKGRRDERIPLHPIVVEHLRRIAGFEQEFFPWPRGVEALYDQFADIQATAGIELACHGDHEHTVACHVYGFHDFRRAFATMNAERLTPDAMQSLMRHKSYTTTQRYINVARQLTRSVEALHVPTLPTAEAHVRRDHVAAS